MKDIAESNGVSKRQQRRGIDTLILKVASRCNLNCSYCYMYNLADSSWKEKPRFMTDVTFSQAIARWFEHAASHSPDMLYLILHGGEPLLAGPERLDRWLTMVRADLPAGNTPVGVGLQTNGLLLNDEVCAVLHSHGVTLGISIDGIPGKGDTHRVDHKGMPSGAQLEEKLLWLQGSKWSSILKGILSVVDVNNDPIETLEYLLRFGPQRLDFRLPLCNHDAHPPRPVGDTDGTSYGKWLAELFRYAVKHDLQIPIRTIDAFINAGVNSQAYQNMVGNTELDSACVVETDGSYELVDNLKSTRDGMTKTGLHVSTHTMDDFVTFGQRWVSENGLGNLWSSAQKCHSCKLYNQCGGFYYAHRYRSSNGFDNESVYCTEVSFLFDYLNQATAD